MQKPPRPTMTAPDRSKPEISYAPKIPISLKRQAESVVLQRAKELCIRHPDIGDLQPLADSLRILKQLGGD